MSKLGESLLIPLGYCGHDWQQLQSEKVEGTLQNTLHVAKKVLLLVPTLFALVPGILGCLIKCASNSPLEEDGNYTAWELQTSPSQQSQCQQLGLYDFSRRDWLVEDSFKNLAQQHPEYPRFPTICVSKEGHVDYFRRTVTLSMGALGVARPNGNDFLRNLTNSFRPSNASPIEFRQIKVLQDLLLGIKSGTHEDYRRLREHLAYSTQIKFTTHWGPNPNYNFGRKLDLKISY